MMRSVKIRGRTWTISCTKKKPKWVRAERGEGTLGCCDHVGMRIWVKNTGNAEECLSTLAHEIDHAVHPEACERVIVEGEDGLYSLLRDNDLSAFRGDS